MDGKKRYLENKARKLLNNFPVIAILGARQVGKTTLAKAIGNNYHYVDLELPSDFSRVQEDPELFFRLHPENLIIDETQELPIIFKILRNVVDQDRQRKGRFIITGSASFELLSRISETLAGRIGTLELSPFKASELQSKPLPEFYNLVHNQAPSKDFLSLKPITSFATMMKTFLKGGYPEPALSQDESFQADWMENYFYTYINRDLRQLYPKLDLIRYRRVIAMLSSLSGTIVNRSEISRSTELSEKAVRDYMKIIEGTFFWRSLPAYITPKIKTATKLPKGFFRDSGLAIFLQNVTTLKQLEEFPKLGNFFESYVVEEVIRGLQATGLRNLRLWHFRTKAGGEIDLIVESSAGTLPIEVKFASHTKAKKLTAMTNFLESHSLNFGIVINNCLKPAMITEKIIEIPAAAIV